MCWILVEWKARFNSPKARHTLKVCILPVVGNSASHYYSWATALWSYDCGVPLFAEGCVETRKSGANCNLLSWLCYWFINKNTQYQDERHYIKQQSQLNILKRRRVILGWCAIALALCKVTYLGKGNNKRLGPWYGPRGSILNTQ